MTPDELKDRTKYFVLRILKAVGAMPISVILANQVGRSGTAIAEADETIFWLGLAADHGSLPRQRLQALIDEASELTAIFAASRKTAPGHPNRHSEIGNRQ
jgi:hypothetical protein